MTTVQIDITIPLLVALDEAAGVRVAALPDDDEEGAAGDDAGF